MGFIHARGRPLRLHAVGIVAACLVGSLSLAIGAPVAAATPPYGNSGTLGPDGAQLRTCSGGACYECSVSSCSPSGSWQSRIENALPGDTVLLRAGTYDPVGVLDIPTGSSGNRITIANYNGEDATITGEVVFASGHVLMEGLTVDSALEAGWTLLIESFTASLISDIELKNMDVLGGEVEAIRIRGHVEDVTIRDSLLDGGANNHVVKVICDEDDNTICNFTPENILIANNKFSKVRSSFFPRPNPGDESNGGSGDLLQLEGAGDVTVAYNEFGESDYEECFDVKRFGRDDATLVVHYNIFDGRNNQTFPSGEPGCRFGGMQVIQTNLNGTTLIEGNYFLGGSSLIRATHSGTQMINNIIDDTELTISNPTTTMTLGYNTFVNPTTRITFGDSAGVPGDLTVINNIFSETQFQGASGSYGPAHNLLYQTTGGTLGSCPTCISADPLLSGYQIRAGSPAIDAASGSFTVSEDVEGTTRPQGSGHDIGAYEVTIASIPTSTPQAIGLLGFLLAAAGTAAVRRTRASRAGARGC